MPAVVRESRRREQLTEGARRRGGGGGGAGRKASDRRQDIDLSQNCTLGKLDTCHLIKSNIEGKLNQILKEQTFCW